jgi:hypothetical protein
MMRSTLLTVGIAAMALLAAVPSDGAAPKSPPRILATDPGDSSTVERDRSNAELGVSIARNAMSNEDLRLEDITIEGDVDIARVLFIESREHLRDQDFLHYLFLPSAAQLGREAPARRILHWSPKGEHQSWTP